MINSCMVALLDSVNVTISVSIYPSSFLSIYFSTYPSIYLSIFLPIYLSIYLSVYLSTYLFASQIIYLYSSRSLSSFLSLYISFPSFVSFTYVPLPMLFPHDTKENYYKAEHSHTTLLYLSRGFQAFPLKQSRFIPHSGKACAGLLCLKIPSRFPGHFRRGRGHFLSAFTRVFYESISPRRRSLLSVFFLFFCEFFTFLFLQL